MAFKQPIPYSNFLNQLIDGSYNELDKLFTPESQGTYKIIYHKINKYYYDLNIPIELYDTIKKYKKEYFIKARFNSIINNENRFEKLIEYITFPNKMVYDKKEKIKDYMTNYTLDCELSENYILIFYDSKNIRFCLDKININDIIKFL
jgi:hypothetical protein